MSPLFRVKRYRRPQRWFTVSLFVFLLAAILTALGWFLR